MITHALTQILTPFIIDISDLKKMSELALITYNTSALKKKKKVKNSHGQEISLFPHGLEGLSLSRSRLSVVGQGVVNTALNPLLPVQSRV